MFKNRRFIFVSAFLLSLLLEFSACQKKDANTTQSQSVEAPPAVVLNVNAISSDAISVDPELAAQFLSDFESLEADTMSSPDGKMFVYCDLEEGCPKIAGVTSKWSSKLAKNKKANLRKKATAANSKNTKKILANTGLVRLDAKIEPPTSNSSSERSSIELISHTNSYLMPAIESELNPGCMDCDKSWADKLMSTGKYVFYGYGLSVVEGVVGVSFVAAPKDLDPVFKLEKIVEVDDNSSSRAAAPIDNNKSKNKYKITEAAVPGTGAIWGCLSASKGECKKCKEGTKIVSGRCVPNNPPSDGGFSGCLNGITGRGCLQCHPAYILGNNTCALRKPGDPKAWAGGIVGCKSAGTFICDVVGPDGKKKDPCSPCVECHSNYTHSGDPTNICVPCPSPNVVSNNKCFTPCASPKQNCTNPKLDLWCCDAADKCGQSSATCIAPTCPSGKKVCNIPGKPKWCCDQTTENCGTTQGQCIPTQSVLCSGHGKAPATQNSTNGGCCSNLTASNGVCCNSNENGLKAGGCCAKEKSDAEGNQCCSSGEHWSVDSRPPGNGACCPTDQEFVNGACCSKAKTYVGTDGYLACCSIDICKTGGGDKCCSADPVNKNCLTSGSTQACCATGQVIAEAKCCDETKATKDFSLCCASDQTPIVNTTGENVCCKSSLVTDNGTVCCTAASGKVVSNGHCCPSNTPIWNGSSCVECNTNAHCGISGKVCSNNKCECPSDKVFDPLRGQCVECINDNQCSNGKSCINNVCDCGTGTVLSNGYCCPSNTPIRNGSHCVECTSDSNCNGDYCDPFQQKCEKCITAGNAVNAQLTNKGCCPGLKEVNGKCGCATDQFCRDKEPADQFCSPDGSCVTCGSDKPYWNGSVCLGCINDSNCGTGKCNIWTSVCEPCVQYNTPVNNDLNDGGCCQGLNPTADNKCGCASEEYCIQHQMGKQCSSGFCYECLTDPDCGSGKLCNSQKKCVPCKTENGQIISGMDNGGCCSGLTSTGGISGVCCPAERPVKGSNGNCVACVTSEQCGAGQFCYNERCIDASSPTPTPSATPSTTTTLPSTTGTTYP